jgi:hypothetical protein
MTIKASRTADVASLIAALGADDEVKRESAIARLAVIGERAVDRLIAGFPQGARDTRIAILRTLERIADPRAIPVAREALREGGDVAVTAAAALRPLLQSADQRVATSALDVLVGAALDATAERRVRMSACESLADMPEAVRAPVADAMRRDGLITRGEDGAALTQATWEDALGGRLPDDPSALRDALDSSGEAAPLGALHKLVDAIRLHESAQAHGPRRDAWQQVRGAVHQALALRGSRLALYDLRETLAEGRIVPPSFLTALHVVGDESCLEPLAAAWTAAGGEESARFRQQIEAAFCAIVKREKTTARSAVKKRLAGRYPDAARALSTPSRTRARPTTAGRT